MGSREDLAALRALVADEREVAGGIEDYCVLLRASDDFDEWVDCPPRLGEPFASDGTEHEFCLLDGGAVVLYTPLAEDTHRVVGADLREFLALLLSGNGAQIGELGYDWDDAVAELVAGPDPEPEETSPEERHALVRLTEVFDLVAWPDLAVRLGELQSLLPPVQRQEPS